MGRRRKRLIIQADFTSEADREFLGWVLERRRKRRLADEIREGLRLLYERERQPGPQRTLADPPPEQPRVVIAEPGPATPDPGRAADKLKRLVGGL